MSLEQKQKVLTALAGGAERVFELQSKLTSLRGLGPDNGGTGEQDKADYLEGWLRSFGITDIEP